jgi:hypothetical protein
MIVHLVDGRVKGFASRGSNDDVTEGSMISREKGSAARGSNLDVPALL